MELLKNMITNTYPNAVIKDITDVAYRVKNADKTKSLMCDLGLDDCNFIVIKNRGNKVFKSIAHVFNIYEYHWSEMFVLIMRGPHIVFLPDSFGKDEEITQSFKKALNTLLAPQHESCYCSICLDVVKLGQGGKVMCNECFKSVCSKCFNEYFIQCESNPGWCPSCRHHMYFTHLVKPEDGDDILNIYFIQTVVRTNLIEFLQSQVNLWKGINHH